MTDLSILIPARNEEFLKRTVEDILANIEADTEIIVTLDGKWADPPIIDNDRVHLIYTPTSIGQRAATNLARKLSKAKYIMKVDAHCSFDEGFDVKLMADIQDDWTVVPIMKNLHAFDWVCLMATAGTKGPAARARNAARKLPGTFCGLPSPRPIVPPTGLIKLSSFNTLESTKPNKKAI